MYEREHVFVFCFVPNLFIIICFAGDVALFLWPRSTVTVRQYEFIPVRKKKRSPQKKKPENRTCFARRIRAKVYCTWRKFYGLLIKMPNNHKSFFWCTSRIRVLFKIKPRVQLLLFCVLRIYGIRDKGTNANANANETLRRLLSCTF